VVDVERLDEVRVLSLTGPSIPLKVTCFGALLHTSLVEHGFERHAGQRALPIAPLPNWPPATRGLKKSAALAEH